MAVQGILFTMRRDRSLPSGVRLIAWMRTIRWVGWGFGEALIPVLIMSLTGTFASAGLLTSTFDITLLLALPVLDERDSLCGAEEVVAP